MSSKNSADRDSQLEHGNQEASVHARSVQHGHSGQGAASALAHMIQQDQKHRRQDAEGKQETRDA